MDGQFDRLNTLLGEHGDSGDKLTVRTYTVEDNEPDAEVPSQNFVLFEGRPKALRFLAETILAHLETDASVLTLHPSGAGCAHFSTDSSVGIALHTLRNL